MIPTRRTRALGYHSVLLAGGHATRLGGRDKAALRIGGTAMLDRVLAAVETASRRIVVGPVDDPGVADLVTREVPPGGGPVAAIAAGIEHVGAPVVIVLAADLPFLTSSIVDSLLAAMVRRVDAAVLVDDGGRDQLLIAAWRTRVLRTRLAAIGDPAGQAVRRLFDNVALARVAVDKDFRQPPPWLDCDTEDDLRQAREWT